MENEIKKPPESVPVKSLKDRFTFWYKNLPNKKTHIEFITAILTVPVMVTVILINLNNLNQSKETSKTIQTIPIQVIITGGVPATVIPTSVLTSTPAPSPTIIPFPTYTPYPTYTPFPTNSVSTTSANL